FFDDEDFKEYQREQEAMNRRLARHPLAIQAREILNIVTTMKDTCSDDDGHTRNLLDTMMASAMTMHVKTRTALRSEMYTLAMQAAAIVRDHASFLLITNHSLRESESIDKDHVKMFRAEMEKYRQLFYDWAGTLKALDNDDDVDEWGLFNR